MIVKATDWDVHYDGLCLQTAKKSKDPQTKLACIIVSRDYSQITSGFNGFCRGVDETKPERWADRKTRYWYVEHAERNAIYNHVRHGGVALFDTIAYIPVFPCVECAKALIQSGIKEVRMNYDRVQKRNRDLAERFSKEEMTAWLIERNQIEAMLEEAGVRVVQYEIEEIN